MFCVVSFLVVHSCQFRHPVTAKAFPPPPSPTPTYPPPGVRRSPPAAPHIAIQTFAHTPTHVYHMVELFGGAIIASIPSTWRDVSLVRQVPGELRVMCRIAGKGEDGSIRYGAADIIIITIPLAKNVFVESC